MTTDDGMTSSARGAMRRRSAAQSSHGDAVAPRSVTGLASFVPTSHGDAVAPHMLDEYEMTDSLREALEVRVEDGLQSYGTMLMTHNGRDASRDLRGELFDALFYAHQIEMETGHPLPFFDRMLTLCEEVNKL